MAVNLVDLDFINSTKRVLSEINVNRKTSFNFLKPAQFLCLKSALECHTLGVLPTGYGKSLIFEALPYFKRSTVLVISPLNSIIEEQVHRYGDNAVHFRENILKNINSNSTLPEQGTELQRLKRCDFKYVIGHPEQFVTKSAFKLFTEEMWQSLVSNIIIDEAHCVTEWGAGFREKFMELSKLKAVFPKANVLALTATATVQLQKKICEALQLENPRVITTNIDRKNIKLEVKKRPAITGGSKTVESSYDFVFADVISELSKQRVNFPKTIIYAKLKWCGYGFEEITRPSTCEESDSGHLQQFVTQYHSPCTSQMRSSVLEEFDKPDSKIRLLLATEAYSMGTDTPDIRRVVHAGAPTSMETYMQEVGRAGRDGKQSTATLYYNKSDISPSVNGMTEEMRQYCDLDTCRRKYVCEHFGFKLSERCEFDHQCCDNCELKCNCDMCIIVRDDLAEGYNLTGDSTCTSSASGNELHLPNKQQTLMNMLCSYFKAENEIISLPNGSLYTGLTHNLAQQISENYQKYKTISNLQKEYPLLSDQIAININNIILAVCLST